VTWLRIAANQVFVRYDPTNGIVGFGTHGIGPFYPVSVGWCTVPLGCGRIGTGAPDITILGALAQLKAAPNDLVSIRQPCARSPPSSGVRPC
jgi:hypothetical protein